MVLELLARDADLEVAQAGDLDGLGERGVGLEQGRRLEVGRPLLGLLQVLRLGPQVDDRLDPVRLLQAPPVRGRGVICFTFPRPRGQRWWSLWKVLLPFCRYCSPLWEEYSVGHGDYVWCVDGVLSKTLHTWPG